MATRLQKNLAKEIVKDLQTGKIRNKKELVISSGYALKTAEGHAPDIIEQKGVQEALEDLGFTVEGADSVVKKILYQGKREENRLRAAEMIYKRLGANIEKPNNNILVITSESAQRFDVATKPETGD